MQSGHDNPSTLCGNKVVLRKPWNCECTPWKSSSSQGKQGIMQMWSILLNNSRNASVFLPVKWGLVYIWIFTGSAQNGIWNRKIHLPMAWVPSHGFGIPGKKQTKIQQKKSCLTKCCLYLFHCAMAHNKPLLFSLLLKWTDLFVCTWNCEEFLTARI